MKLFPLVPSVVALRFSVSAGLLVAALSAIQPAQATAYTWSSNGSTTPVDGSGTWNTALTRWVNSGTAFAWTNSASNDAVIGNGGTAGTITLNTGTTLIAGDVKFNAGTTGNYTLAPANATNDKLSASSITVDTGGTTTIGVSLAATSWAKSGTGSLLITANSTGTGTLTVNSGTLIANPVGSSGVSSSTVTVKSGATLANGRTEAFANTATINLESGGNWILGSAALTGQVETLGFLQGSGTVTTFGTANIQRFAMTLGSGTSTFSGIITGGGRVDVTGATNTSGVQVFTSASNSYLGTTNVSGGTLEVTKIANGGLVSSIGASANAANQLTISAGGTLRYIGTGDTTDRSFTINTLAGTLDASGSGALIVIPTVGSGILGQSATGDSVFTLSGTSTANNTLGGIWRDGTTSGTNSLVKAGTGKWILTGNNTYTGSTAINGGVLATGTNERLANASSLVVNTGGTFDLSTFTETVANVTVNGGSIIGSSGTLISTNTYNVQSGSVSAKLAGSVGLTKSGTGTATLSGSNSYTGATAVNAGTLVVNGFTGSSAVTVGSTATLSGTGTVGTLTVLSGGTLAPGNSPGVINSGTFNLNSGATLAMEFTGSTASPVAGTNNDQVNVTGSVTLAGDLSLTLTSYVQVTDSVFFLINNDGSDPVTGFFANANYGTSTVFTLGGQQWQINYNADFGTTTAANFTSALGNDVALLAVPEPGTVALLGLGGVVTLLAMRRKRVA